jgi:hypothetical protein
MSDEVTEIELTDEELDEYMSVAFAMGNTTGFSKGTANVSANDLKKLRPLIRFYAKKPHPFRACVQDNAKRFGPLVNKYCAIIKDLIEGNTKWRNQSKKKHLSDQTLNELYALSVPDGFFAFLSELTDEEVQEMMIDPEESADFAQGQVAWNYKKGEQYLRRELESALNPQVDSGSDGPVSYGMRYWVNDTNEEENTALVCQGGDTYWVVPFSVKDGEVTVSPEDKWKAVEQAWVQANFSEEPGLMAEMYFADKKASKPDKDGLIWKPIMREGTWKFSPGSDQQANPKPIKIVANGKSDRKNLVISLEELKSNFEEGAKEHVTIPTSHKDGVLENTGFVKKVRIGKDEEGRAVLEAGHDFTEPDVRDKALRGTIANTSAGILFDYVHKETGKKYRSVLAHVALTNHPWLNGMKPFGVNASEEENLEIVSFSEEPIIDPAQTGGGEGMSEVAFDFSELGFNSREELELALAERKSLKAKDRERDVADRCRKWQEDGKSPALVAEAQAIMMSDEGATVLNLSEEGKQVGLSATDIVERLVSKSASVKLTQDAVEEKTASEDKPDDDKNEVKLTQEERVLASQLFFDAGLSQEKAVEEAKRRLAAQTDGK